MIDIPCVIFAGGKSSRMGEDKALLPFANFPTLTQYQLHKFQPHFRDVYISCKSKEKFDFKANFIEDNPSYQTNTPLIALLSIFESVQDDSIAVLSVDTPFFQAKHFEKLLYHDSKERAIIVSKSNTRIQPLCAIYKRDIVPIIIEQIEKKRYRFSELFDKIPTTFVDFNDEEIFTNLNFPQDYQRALQRSKHG